MSLLLCIGFLASIFLIFVFSMGIVGYSFLYKEKTKNLDSEFIFSSSILLGSIVIVVLISLMRLFSLSSLGMRSSILLLLIVCSLSSVKSFINIIKLNQQLILLWFVVVLFYVISILDINLNLNNFVLSDIQKQFALPIDNLIQFQTVRFITENLSPTLLDPVPTWKFGDRGPFFGILISSVFLILDLRESLPWLSSSYPAAIIFEICGIILNSFYILPVFSVIKRRINEKTAYFAILLLAINPYLYINTVFTWPKLFAASFGIIALDIIFQKKVEKNYFSVMLAGALFSVGFLTHENIIFNLLAFLIILFRFSKVKSIFYFLLTFLLIQSPWIIYKQVYGQASLNLMLYNAFCIEVGSISSGSTISNIIEIFKSKSISEIFLVRLNNFLYPVNITLLNWSEIFESLSLYRFISSTTDILFYQFIYAFGLIPTCYIIYKFIFSRNFNHKAVLALFLTSMLSVGVFQGCPLSTWNHIWAFLPFIGMTVYFAIIVSYEKIYLKASLVIIHVYVMLSYLQNYIWFPPRSAVRYVANSSRDSALVGLIFFLGVYFFYILIFRKEKKI